LVELIHYKISEWIFILKLNEETGGLTSEMADRRNGTRTQVVLLYQPLFLEGTMEGVRESEDFLRRRETMRLT
jgi:hypothetical protein